MVTAFFAISTSIGVLFDLLAGTVDLRVGHGDRRLGLLQVGLLDATCRIRRAARSPLTSWPAMTNTFTTVPDCSTGGQEIRHG